MKTPNTPVLEAEASVFQRLYEVIWMSKKK